MYGVGRTLAVKILNATKIDLAKRAKDLTQDEVSRIKEYIEKMDYFGIDYALVSHWDAVANNPSIGNKRLIKEIKGYDRLYPCWVVMPYQTGEILRCAQNDGVLVPP